MMPHASNTCPGPQFFDRLLGDALDAQEQRDLEHHLDACAPCRARLEALVGGGGEPDWPARVRRLAALRNDAFPGLARAIGSLKQEFAARNEPSRPAPPPADHAEVLHFLDPPETPGDLGTFGGYRVLEVLGQGGMGLVLRAFDPALSRPIAIKVLAPQLAGSGPARRRFLREARASAAIRDEHVVAIHAVDEWKGLPYLVMELIPGTSLQDRIDRAAPLDVGSVLRIGMQAASGLAAAHAQGLVHRDIKPSNILLENGVERVKLTDFGLARAVDDASLTQSGVVAGTPLFMSPEQAHGEAIDHRADLFSLGAVMYAMCTGRPPFRASTTLGVLRRVCDDEHRPIPEINPEVPTWLAEIIDRLLAKAPRDRFANAKEVSHVLGDRLAWLQRGPSPVRAAWKPLPAVAVEEVGPAKSRQRPARWNWLLVGLLAFLTLFVLLEWKEIVRRVVDLFPGQPPSTLEVQLDDPRIRVLVDGRPMGNPGDQLPRTRLDSGRHRVEAFLDDRKLGGYMVEIRPGRTLTLHFPADAPAEVEAASAGAAEPDGPPPSPKLGLREQYLLDHLKGLKNDRDGVRRQLDEQQKRVSWARSMQEKGYVSPEGVAVETVRLRVLQEQLSHLEAAVQEAESRSAAGKPLEGDDLKDAIAERFRADPEVKALIEEITKTQDMIEAVSRTVRSPQDPALVEHMKLLRELHKLYAKLWEFKSPLIRDSFRPLHR